MTLYSRTVCKLCDRMKLRLTEAGVTFETINLDLPEYDDARTYVTQVLGAKSVPVVVSDVYPPILVFQPEKIKQLVRALTLNDRNTDGP